MFLQNKYTKWYFSIVERARTRQLAGYQESHHIIPKCFGGSNKKENRVNLTAKEHFICHVLLVKMFSDKYSIMKMITALNSMAMKNKFTTMRYVNGNLYQQNRLKFMEFYKGENTSFYGRMHSDETKKKMSKAHKGVKKTPDAVSKSVLSKSIGIVVTPWGTFNSFFAAKNHCDNFIGDNSTIKKYCTSKNSETIKEHPQINPALWNKTPKSLGFDFIPKEHNGVS